MTRLVLMTFNRPHVSPARANALMTGDWDNVWRLSSVSNAFICVTAWEWEFRNVFTVSCYE